MALKTVNSVDFQRTSLTCPTIHSVILHEKGKYVVVAHFLDTADHRNKFPIGDDLASPAVVEVGVYVWPDKKAKPEFVFSKTIMEFASKPVRAFRSVSSPVNYERVKQNCKELFETDFSELKSWCAKSAKCDNKTARKAKDIKILLDRAETDPLLTSNQILEICKNKD